MEPELALLFLLLLLLLGLGLGLDGEDGCFPAAAAAGDGVGGLRWRTMGGAGKLLRLSTASTVRWKRRKRVWARSKVDGRSIVLESSLTIN